MSFPTNEQLVAQYYKLSDERDALYGKAKPLEDELTSINSEIEKLRLRANELATRIDEGLGGEKFLTLKKEIARIAGFLGKIPARKAA